MSNEDLDDDYELPDEVDFTGAEQGKHFLEYMRARHLAVIDEELVPFFPTVGSVNEALRFLVRMAGAIQEQLARIMQAHKPTRRDLEVIRIHDSPSPIFCDRAYSTPDSISDHSCSRPSVQPRIPSWILRLLQQISHRA